MGRFFCTHAVLTELFQLYQDTVHFLSRMGILLGFRGDACKKNGASQEGT